MSNKITRTRCRRLTKSAKSTSSLLCTQPSSSSAQQLAVAAAAVGVQKYSSCSMNGGRKPYGYSPEAAEARVIPKAQAHLELESSESEDFIGRTYFRNVVSLIGLPSTLDRTSQEKTPGNGNRLHVQSSSSSSSKLTRYFPHGPLTLKVPVPHFSDIGPVLVPPKNSDKSAYFGFQVIEDFDKDAGMQRSGGSNLDLDFEPEGEIFRNDGTDDSDKSEMEEPEAEAEAKPEQKPKRQVGSSSSSTTEDEELEPELDSDDEPIPVCHDEQFRWLYDTMFKSKRKLPSKQEQPFMALPQELRLKIIRFIPPHLRSGLIKTNRTLAFEIRSRAGIIVRLTEDTLEGPSFTRDIIVESVLVGNFTRPLLHPNKLIFQPENVRELRICYPIAMQCLDGFLTRCRKIRYLYIHAPVYLRRLPPIPYKRCKRTIRWRKLFTITRYPATLEALTTLSITMPAKHFLDSLDIIFFLVRTRSLAQLILEVTGPVCEASTSAIHQRCIYYIKKNPSITHFTIKAEPAAAGDEGPVDPGLGLGPGPLFPAKPRQVQFTANIRLGHVTLLERCVNLDIWLTILAAQTHLQTYKVLQPAPWSLQRLIIRHNCRFMTKIGIHSLLIPRTPGGGCSLSLEVFQPCRSLQELYICVGGDIVPGTSDIINFHKLPKNMLTFGLRNAAVKSTEISKLRLLPKLKSVGLVNLLSPSGYGITLESFGALIWLRSLDELAFSDGTPLHMRKRHDPDRFEPYAEPFLSVLDMLDGKVTTPRYWKNCVHLRNGQESRWTIDKQDRHEFKYNIV